MLNIKSFACYVNEKTIVREISHLAKDETVIMTAWRSTLTASENIGRMREMQKRLSTLYYGFVKMDGIGQEIDTESKEKSLMVINDRSDPNFLNQMLDLAEEFKQDFIVHGKDGMYDLILVSDRSIAQKFSTVDAGIDRFYSKVANGVFALK